MESFTSEKLHRKAECTAEVSFNLAYVTQMTLTFILIQNTRSSLIFQNNNEARTSILDKDKSQRHLCSIS